MAKVDILIPFWGDVSLLKTAVQSVLSQTETDWFLYVVDDCSPDKTAREFIYSLSDDRITYIRHKRNIGITNNFNYALSLANSPYCIIMGCDDVLLEDYIETALQNIGVADLYQPVVAVIDEYGNDYLPLTDKIKKILRPKRSGLYEGEAVAISLCKGNWLYFPSILWKTSSVKRYAFNPRYAILEDLVLIMDMIADGAILFVDNTGSAVFQYRRSSISLSSKEKKKGGVRFSEEKEVYNLFARRFQVLGWKKASCLAKLRPTSRIHQLLSKLPSR